MTFTPVVLGTGAGGYAFLTRTRETQQAMFANSGEVARDVTKFKERLNTVQTADQLLEDRSLLKVALGAFGLDEDIGNRAFIKQILESDLSDNTSLANRLADKRYLEFARTFNFAGEGGPSAAAFKTGEEVALDLGNIQSADDLLADTRLLRATLASVGLEGDIGNAFFLKRVLESDPDDATSFASRLSDPRYVELARAFDLTGRQQSQNSIYGLAERMSAGLGAIATVDTLMQNTDMLAASLAVFGLEADIDRPDFIAAVLASDPRDDQSFVNQQDDSRYTALAEAFGFVRRTEAEAAGDIYESRIETLVKVVSTRDTQIESPEAFFQDIPLMLATFDFFDLPSRPDAVPFANRLLTSDSTSPTSLVNVTSDPRYRAFASGLGLGQKPQERTYPSGFAQGIIETYLERQFEISIGNSDPTMRFALALERDLGQAVDGGRSNDARWYSVLASKPLREVFETVFQLPTSFGTLDIDRQLTEFKDRATRMFGTDQIAEFTAPAQIEQLRKYYLVRSDAALTAPSTQVSSVLALLANAT